MRSIGIGIAATGLGLALGLAAEVRGQSSSPRYVPAAPTQRQGPPRAVAPPVRFESRPTPAPSPYRPGAVLTPADPVPPAPPATPIPTPSPAPPATPIPPAWPDDPGPVYPGPPILVPSPIVIFNPPAPVPIYYGPVGGGLMLPPGPPMNVPAPTTKRPAPRPDPDRSDAFVTVGDRLFRAGNTRRAVERYEQARKADPTSARPVVRLAHLAAAKGDYRTAAARFRVAQATDPGWLVEADDVQALFGEPADFHKLIADLESHVQAHPDDRDAWLVLGAEHFLSGRARQASDIFARLNDRRPDATLAAFLDATTPDPPPGRGTPTP